MVSQSLSKLFIYGEILVLEVMKITGYMQTSDHGKGGTQSALTKDKSLMLAYLTCDDCDLGNCGLSVCVQQLGTMTNDTVELLVGSYNDKKASSYHVPVRYSKNLGVSLDNLVYSKWWENGK